MVSKGAKRSRSMQEMPAYPLDEVNQLIAEGKVDFWPNALRLAKNDFGWSPKEIIEAVGRLRPIDFHKREQCDHYPKIVLDVYRPRRRIKAEWIYLHLYINDETNQLIINSCKER